MGSRKRYNRAHTALKGSKADYELIRTMIGVEKIVDEVQKLAKDPKAIRKKRALREKELVRPASEAPTEVLEDIDTVTLNISGNSSSPDSPRAEDDVIHDVEHIEGESDFEETDPAGQEAEPSWVGPAGQATGPSLVDPEPPHLNLLGSGREGILGNGPKKSTYAQKTETLGDEIPLTKEAMEAVSNLEEMKLVLKWLLKEVMLLRAKFDNMEVKFAKQLANMKSHCQLERERKRKILEKSVPAGVGKKAIADRP